MGKVLLEYANSCGLLVEVTGTPNLIQILFRHLEVGQQHQSSVLM